MGRHILVRDLIPVLELSSTEMGVDVEDGGVEMAPSLPSLHVMFQEVHDVRARITKMITSDYVAHSYLTQEHATHPSQALGNDVVNFVLGVFRTGIAVVVDQVRGILIGHHISAGEPLLRHDLVGVRKKEPVSTSTIVRENGNCRWWIALTNENHTHMGPMSSNKEVEGRYAVLSLPVRLERLALPIPIVNPMAVIVTKSRRSSGLASFWHVRVAVSAQE